MLHHSLCLLVFRRGPFMWDDVSYSTEVPLESGSSIQKKDYKSGGNNPDSTLDRDWARNSFMLGDVNLTDKDDIKNRYWSTAQSKFTDGRIGCNIGINCRPQITPYSDIRFKGRLSGRAEPSLSETTGNYGMGRYYSEAYDDPAQIIYMRFGVPQFNSLVNYLTRAFDPGLSTITRTGRIPSALYDVGKLFGTYLAVTTFPIITVPLLAGKVIGAFFNRSTSKFYTLKPTMHLYWSTVNTLVNTIAVTSGIFPKIMGDNKDDTQKLGKTFKIDQEYLSMYSKLMPDVFTEENYFDVFALATRAQRLANQVYADDFERFNKGTATDFTGYLKRDNTGDKTHSTPISGKDGKINTLMLINEAVKLKKLFGYDNESTTIEVDPRIDPNDKEGKEKPPDGIDKFVEYFDAQFRAGADFAVFRVDHTGAVSESFSNSAGESDLSQKLNSTSSTFQQARFSMANGNIIGGAIGEVAGTVVDAAGDLLTGALSGLTGGFSDVLKGLMGEGFVDIPKHWMSSSASLPKANYSIQLVTPYGNVMSRMLNLNIPLCMLLAAALPRSTGKQSYTSPFLCQIFDRGRCQIRLGMIDSLTITRGTGDLAFDTNGNPLAIDINFSVTDLSSIMHMPVTSGEIFKFDATMDEDNILTDYLAVLGGQDIYTQIYPLAAARIRLAKMAIQKGKLTSPAFWASTTHDTLKGLGVGKILEGVARGNETLAGNN